MNMPNIIPLHALPRRAYAARATQSNGSDRPPAPASTRAQVHKTPPCPPSNRLEEWNPNPHETGPATQDTHTLHKSATDLRRTNGYLPYLGYRGIRAVASLVITKSRHQPSQGSYSSRRLGWSVPRSVLA